MATSTTARKAGQPIYRLGIDVETRHVSRLQQRLDYLANTLTTRNAGAYNEDSTYSQLWIDTYWSESKLNDWLCNTKHSCEWQGTWERGSHQVID